MLEVNTRELNLLWVYPLPYIRLKEEKERPVWESTVEIQGDEDEQQEQEEKNFRRDEDGKNIYRLKQRRLTIFPNLIRWNYRT